MKSFVVLLNVMAPHLSWTLEQQQWFSIGPHRLKMSAILPQIGEALLRKTTQFSDAGHGPMTHEARSVRPEPKRTQGMERWHAGQRARAAAAASAQQYQRGGPGNGNVAGVLTQRRRWDDPLKDWARARYRNWEFVRGKVTKQTFVFVLPGGGARLAGNP